MSNVLDPIVSFARNDAKMRVVAITTTQSGQYATGSAQAIGLETVDQVLAVYLTGAGATTGAQMFAAPSINGNVVGVSVITLSTNVVAQVLVLGY